MWIKKEWKKNENGGGKCARYEKRLKVIFLTVCPRIGRAVSTWDFVVFQCCFDILQLAPKSFAMPKSCCLGSSDWPQTTRLIFILLQTFFNAPKCIALKVLPSCSHPNMSNLNLLYHTGRDVDCFPLWMLICFARGYLKADSECILAVGDWARWECLDFDPGRCWQILMTCCFMNESNVPLGKKKGGEVAQLQSEWPVRYLLFTFSQNRQRPKSSWESQIGSTNLLPRPLAVFYSIFFKFFTEASGTLCRRDGKSFNRILICSINLCKWCRAAVWRC